MQMNDRNRFLEYIIEKYNEKDRPISLWLLSTDYAQVRSEAGKHKHYWMGVVAS